MSDYISKSVLIESLDKSKNQPTRDTDDFIEGYCEGWNNVVTIIQNQTTVDEKEIIRKPFERVVERLEAEQTKSVQNKEEAIAFMCTKSVDFYNGEKCAYKNSIEICKEVGGIE